MRLTKEQTILVDKLKKKKAEFRQDEENIILIESRPGNFPCLVLKFWDKKDFPKK